MSVSLLPYSRHMAKRLDHLGEGVQVDALEAWNRIGRELAVLDPGRFRRYLHAAEAVVALYETQDPDRALADRLALISDSADFDA